MDADHTRVAGGRATRGAIPWASEKANIGGFLGVRVPLAKKLYLTVETQYKERFGAGGVVAYAF